jgi:hypothetical protein
MTALSTLLGSGSSGGGVKSVQTGFLDNVTASSDAGEDAKYYDVTLGTAVVVANCVCFFQGAYGVNDDQGTHKAGTTTAHEPTIRVTTTTNLRIASANSATKLIGRWYVVEFDIA